MASFFLPLHLSSFSQVVAQVKGGGNLEDEENFPPGEKEVLICTLSLVEARPKEKKSPRVEEQEINASNLRDIQTFSDPVGPWVG